MKGKDIKRYVGNIELEINSTEEEMIERHRIDLDHLQRLDVEPQGHVQIRVDEKLLRTIPPNTIDFGLAEVALVDTIPANGRITVRNLIQALYLYGLFPRNHDWHMDNLAIIDPQIQGYIFLAKNRNIGLIVTNNKIDKYSGILGEILRTTICTRIEHAIKIVDKGTTKEKLIHIKSEPIFIPRFYKGPVPKKGEQRDPSKVENSFVYEFTYRDDNGNDCEVLSITPKN